METMLWDISVIPNEQDKRYLMLPPGVLHMSALGRFGRFTLFFTSRLTFQTLAVSLFFGVGVLGLGWLLLCCVFVSCFASVLESRILRAF